jgi:transketolase
VTIAAAGITVHEALRAADELAGDGIPVRVIDLYSIKPIDESALLAAGRETGSIITVEDHHAEGGLGEAVMAVFAGSDVKPRIRVLAVREMPGSAPGGELMAVAGIDARHIVAAAREMTAAGARGLVTGGRRR